MVDAGDGVEVLSDEDEADPHIWHDPTRAKTMVANLTEALAQADPEQAQVYRGAMSGVGGLAISHRWSVAAGAAVVLVAAAIFALSVVAGPSLQHHGRSYLRVAVAVNPYSRRRR